MRTEVIKNPDIQLGLRYWEDFSPVLSHFEVQHGYPIISSTNPIINQLVANGWEVHLTHTEFFMGYPSGLHILKNHFLARVRDEYEIRLEDDGFLRFRFEGSDSVYLTLFYIHPEKQGKGLGRKWFLPVTDALFDAGVPSLRGGVSPSYYESKEKMDTERLTKFYVSQGFRRTGDGHIVKKSPCKVGRETSCLGPVAVKDSESKMALAA